MGTGIVRDSRERLISALSTCTRLRLASLVLVAALPQAVFAESKTHARPCNEWKAVYVSQPDEEGTQVYAAFGKARGSDPMPFTLSGFDRTATQTWQYKSVAWCFLGAGGCHVGLRMKGESMEAASERPLRITFVRSSKTDTKATPDILVVSGLGAEFLDDAKATGAQTLAIERLKGAPGIVVPPDVFYFERCNDR